MSCTEDGCCVDGVCEVCTCCDRGSCSDEPLTLDMGLTREEIAVLDVGAVLYDRYGVEWEQTDAGRWWDKSYPENTRLELAERGDLYLRYYPFRIKKDLTNDEKGVD